MNSTIDKLLNGEVLSEKEAKVVHVFLNNVELDVDSTYDKIVSAEAALASGSDKNILIELITNDMNSGLWKGIERYKYLLSFRSEQTEHLPDNRNIENIIKFTNPAHIIGNARNILLEKFKISIFQNRKTFNDFIDTSSIEFLDEFMKSYKAVCIIEPESEEDMNQKAMDNFSKRVASSLPDGTQIKILNIEEGKIPPIIRISNFLMQLQGANDFYRMSKGHSNLFTAFFRMKIDKYKDKHNLFKIDPKENKRHIADKYHEKILLGKDALCDYIKSL